MTHCRISRRIIDACLRENVFGLLDRVQGADHPPAEFADAFGARQCLYLHFQQRALCLPVQASRYMQAWRALDDWWLEREGDRWLRRQGYADWLALLGHRAPADVQDALRTYRCEADTALAHQHLCSQAFAAQHHRLAAGLSDCTTWQARLQLGEQVAAFKDHPYYPTARAKVGFDEAALRRYAPEFAPSFQLRWLAVDKQLLTQVAPAPACWPSMAMLGLPADFAASHALLPVHPLTWDSLQDLPAGILKLSRAALTVQPTLSVRTLLVTDAPETHIKVPLLMRSLGNKNLRLIKPSTLHDGQRVAHILLQLAAQDPHLRGRYHHCDESHGAHVGDDRRLAYIVRQYPSAVTGDSTLVPVAALAAPLPDGRVYLEQLLTEFYQGDLDAWLDHYLALLLGVHLRLWLVYGIALEANQQNAVLVLHPRAPMTLLMKDNDAARLWPARFTSAAPTLSDQPAAFIDRRIVVDAELPLAQMFTTITLQLNIAALFEALIARGLGNRARLYGKLRRAVETELAALAAAGADTRCAQQTLLDSEFLYAKYLLSAGSLLSKQQSGASDINKHYGLSAPNFLRGG